MPGPGSANIQSLDAVRDVRLVLIAFGERSELALAELRAKIDRTLSWLEQDRPMYWREQERRAYDAVASARVAYEACRTRTVGGRHSECIEEKIALQRAKARLEFCHQKMEVVRRWNVEAARQVDEYRGRSGPLQRRLEDEVPKVAALLSRMIESLEAYADVRLAEATSPPITLGSTDETRDTVAPAPSAPSVPLATNDPNGNTEESSPNP